MICCFCKREIDEKSSHDIRPLVSTDGNRCCSDCNQNIVIANRLKFWMNSLYGYGVMDLNTNKLYSTNNELATNINNTLVFKDEQEVELSIVHPGITLTNMTSHYHKAINWLVKIGVKLLFPNPKKASLNILYGINHYTVYHEWIGPSLFNIWGKPKIKKLKTCSKKESNIIFQIAEKIYKNII